jgi:hypothetical protein
MKITLPWRAIAATTLFVFTCGQSVFAAEALVWGDTYTRAGSNSNYGGAASLTVGSYNSGSQDTYRAYMKFSMNTLPPSVTTDKYVSG